MAIAFSPWGSMFAADTFNNRIDEFTTAGVKVASCPNTTRLTSSFNWPMAIAFSPSGTMFVADTFNNRVEAVSVSQCTSSSTVTPLWSIGTRGIGTGQFIKPWDVVYDTALNAVLVTDTDNSRIVSLNASTGAWNGVLPITKGTAARGLTDPGGIAGD